MNAAMGCALLGEEENRNASALTAPFLATFDAVIDFTTPEAVVPNLRACLANGARVVVGTTGWYERLEDMRTLAVRKNAGLLYGTNFSVGVQALLRMARELAHSCAALPFQHYRDAPRGQERCAFGNGVVDPAGAGGGKSDTESGNRFKREGDASGIH